MDTRLRCTETCSNCKHWKRDETGASQGDDSLAYKVGLGECSEAAFLPDAFAWDYNSDVEEADGSDPIKFLLEKDKAMFTMDGSSYRACLYTRPTFGCNQFEDKNNDN